ncbi:TPA: helix-turn-helix domain-containing protein [Klebsiella pneumoniae]|nr:helix-turn-helix domain-containing protein [Klebsiella pneumoniae]
MLKNQVVEYYGGISKTAIALGVTHSAVCQWGNVISQKQAFVIERITNGKLKYDASLYQKATD